MNTNYTSHSTRFEALDDLILTNYHARISEIQSYEFKRQEAGDVHSPPQENAAKSITKAITCLKGDELSIYTEINQIYSLCFTKDVCFDWPEDLSPDRRTSFANFGKLTLIVKTPTINTDRSLGVVLDEMGVKSTNFVNFDSRTYREDSSEFVLTSTNRDKVSGSPFLGSRTYKFKSPVFGVMVDDNGKLIKSPKEEIIYPLKKKSIKYLIFNLDAMNSVLTILSQLANIENELEQLFPTVISEIIRSYSDWTDRGYACRQILKEFNKHLISISFPRMFRKHQ